MQQAGPCVAGPQGWELSLPCLCPNALSGFPAVAPGAEKSSWRAGGLAGSWGGQPQTPQIPCYSRNTPALEMPPWDGTSAGVGGHPQLPPPLENRGLRREFQPSPGSASPLGGLGGQRCLVLEMGDRGLEGGRKAFARGNRYPVKSNY